MTQQHSAFDERQVLAAALYSPENLTARLNAGEPIPNALLGDAVDGLDGAGASRCPNPGSVTNSRPSPT
jgi:hypothetical protein